MTGASDFGRERSPSTGMRPTLATIASVLIIALSSGSPLVGAWSNGGYSADQNDPDYGTHDWIADAALAMQTRDASFLKTTYHLKFILGTEAPDNPDFIGDSVNHHVYFWSSGTLQDDACAERASASYTTALDYLKAGDLQAAAYDIGVMTHYVSDPGVFGHTMGSSTDWGAEIHHSDYENHFESIIGTLVRPPGPLGDETAYSATTDLAKDITFGSGDIKANTWMDSRYDWSNVQFATSARASMNRSVLAVASVINHLLIEAEPINPPPPGTSKPGPPLNVSAVAGAEAVLVTWSPPSSDGGALITSYRVYRGGADPVQIAVVAVSVTSWTDRSMVRGESYTYWVAAENSAGVGNLSIPVTVTIPPKHSQSIVLPAVVSATIVSLVTGVALLLRRRKR